MAASKTSFKPGASGNLTGRKPDKEVRALARKYTAQAINTLAVLMTAKAEKGSTRVAAAVALLDRGWGKAPIALTGEGGEGAAQLVVQLVRFSEEA